VAAALLGTLGASSLVLGLWEPGLPEATALSLFSVRLASWRRLDEVVSGSLRFAADAAVVVVDDVHAGVLAAGLGDLCFALHVSAWPVKPLAFAALLAAACLYAAAALCMLEALPRTRDFFPDALLWGLVGAECVAALTWLILASIPRDGQG